jgi:hypothetical protein
MKGENHAAASRGPPRGCIKKMNSSCEKASQAAGGKMSTGAKALVRRATKELRHADKEMEAEASGAAMLNWEACQEQRRKESSNAATAELLERVAGYGVCECGKGAGDEAARLVSLQDSLLACYGGARQQGVCCRGDRRAHYLLWLLLASRCSPQLLSRRWFARGSTRRELSTPRILQTRSHT